MPYIYMHILLHMYATVLMLLYNTHKNQKYERMK